MKKLKAKQLKEDICTSLESCKYTREEIINKLIEADIDDISLSVKVYNLNNSHIKSILMDGCKGYNNMSFTELKEEYKQRFDEEI